jgi:MHS family proline/betaine transporter-like MFS transporter
MSIDSSTDLSHFRQRILPISVTLLGTISHYYNYASFGLMADFLASEFLPKTKFKIIYLFTALGLAVLVRPLASLIFGTIGDISGRSKALKLTCLLSVIAMISVCLIPPFEKIGYVAVVVLIISRVLVLASLTGQTDGIRIYISEQFSSSNMNFANASVSCATQIGVLLATLTIFIVKKYLLPLRFVFALGAALCLLALLSRSFICESREFINNKTKVSINDFARRNWQMLLIAALINGCIGGIYTFFVIFMSSYADHIIKQPHWFMPLSIVLYAFFALISGYIADKISFFYQAFIALGLAFFVCVACMMKLYNNHSINPVFINTQMVLFAFYAIPMQIYLKNFLPTSVRYRVFSLCHSLGSMLISMPTPIIASFIWVKTGALWLNFLYPLMLFALLITCLCILIRAARIAKKP